MGMAMYKDVTPGLRQEVWCLMGAWRRIARLSGVNASFDQRHYTLESY